PLQGVRELQVLDLDDDGMLDIVGRLDNRTAILRNLGHWSFVYTQAWPSALGRLQSFTSEPADANPTEWITDARVLAAGPFDYDNDGRPDTWVWTDDVKRPLRLFHNEGGTKFTETTNLLPSLPSINSP